MKNKKSNTIFNKGLYVEGLKQLKSLGFIFLGLTLFLTFVNIFGRVNEIENMYSYIKSHLPETIDVMRQFGAMRLIYIFVVPIMTISLFSFLTKRNACDYYHAFPQTRTCQLISYFASVTTWILAIIWSNILISLLLFKIYSKYFVIMSGSALYFGLVISICSILVIAAIVLSSTLTGTTFTNIIGTGLILFLPRAIIAYCMGIITSRYDILLSDSVLPILDFKYNLLIGNLLDLVNYSSEPYSFLTSSMIYTIVLIVIYLGLAVLFTNKRPSEAAGKAAIGHKLQTGIRVCIGLIVSLLPLSGILENYYYNYSNFDSDMFYIVVFYMVAIIVMMVYELISTKNIKNLKKVVSSTIVLAITNIVLFFGIVGIGKGLVNYSPDISDIDYVKVQLDYNQYDYLSDNYFKLKAAQIKYTDEEIIKLLVDSLNDNISICKNGSVNDYIYDNDLASFERPKYVKLTIKDGLFEKTRLIFVRNADYQKLTNIITQSEEYNKIYTHLPVYDNHVKLSEESHRSEAHYKLDKVKLYNSLRKELIELNNPKAYKPVSSINSSLYYTMQMYYDNTSINGYTDLAISYQNTPKTYDLYAKSLNNIVYNDYNSELTTLYNKLKDSDKTVILRNLEFTAYSVDGESYGDVLNYVSASSRTVNFELLNEIISCGIDKDIDTTKEISNKKLCAIKVSYTNKKTPIDVMYFAYIDETLLDKEQSDIFDEYDEYKEYETYTEYETYVEDETYAE